MIYALKILFSKKKTSIIDTEPSIKKAIDSPEVKSNVKRKIFSSRRNEDTKSFKFNLNPNTEDTNLNIASKESLNDACIFDSNSSCSNSPTSNESKLKDIRVNIQSNSEDGIKSSQSSNSFPCDKNSDVLNLDIKLRDSRKAYECEELGENQAFLDDVEYLFDGLNANYKLSDRCLCAIKLAESCLSSEFRMNLRLSNEYINRIFKSLGDSVNYQSLALCTALVMFALTQDKLIMEIGKETFKLILSVINMKQVHEFPVPTVKTKSKRLASSKQTNKIFNANREKTHESTNIDNDNNDNDLYNKLFKRCKDLTEKLTRLGNEKHIPDANFKKHQIFYSPESPNTSFDETLDNDSSHKKFNELDNFTSTEFNAPLLAIECIFNMGLNKQHDVPVDWYKNELRNLGVFDKLLHTLRSTFELIKKSEGLRSYSFFLNKYLRYFNFLECIMQSSTSALASFSALENKTGCKKLKAITANEDEEALDTTIPISVLNQNYLIKFKKNYLTRLIKESLEYFYGEIISIKQSKFPDESRQALILNSIKVNLLLVINLTHNNESVSREIANDDKLINLIFNCISNIVDYLGKDEQFDLLIMSMSILLNIFDSSSSSDIKQTIVLSQNIATYEIIIKLYKTKENLVSLAEHDQDNEFKLLAEQLESQNEENINTAIMNSIHKAGKHMEDHLIAAYSALLIGHILQCHEEFIEEVRLKMKDNSFKYMALIIRKFLVFMKIMNVNGFSADQNVNKIIKFLEKT